MRDRSRYVAAATSDSGGRDGSYRVAQEAGAVGSWYVGIWYHKISVRTPVWVANRDRPVSDPAASRLTIASDGNLVLLDPSGSSAWSTDASVSSGGNVTVVAVLLDTGNLVLAPSRNASYVLWQSFDHIGDTWLPGAKLRRDKVTGVIHGAISWRAPWDPVPGPYTLQLDPGGSPQYVLLRNGTRESYWGSGNWNGRTFTDTPEVSFRFVDNDQESYFTYTFTDNSTMYHLVVDVSGQLKELEWVEDTQAWSLVNEEPRWECYVPQRCGSFGVCSMAVAGEPACRCASGFGPQDAARWSLGDYSGGCVRNAELQCGGSAGRSKSKEDTFFLMLNIAYPDDGRVAVGTSSSSGDCERACLSDCTCSAYAYNGSCILWRGDLQNLKNIYVRYSSLYLRLAASELPDARNHKRRTVEIAVSALAIVCFVVAASVLIVLSQRKFTLLPTRLAKLSVNGIIFDFLTTSLAPLHVRSRPAWLYRDFNDAGRTQRGLGSDVPESVLKVAVEAIDRRVVLPSMFDYPEVRPSRLPGEGRQLDPAVPTRWRQQFATGKGKKARSPSPPSSDSEGGSPPPAGGASPNRCPD
ncbi:hypothetical protein PR202_ga04746 [Eleusine coracana subsp. coracana]|uniref:non-specific serine/threonine protein kinase n=1 Tax=Eleusine coracana subsp. coracana TaxID=191504 RepID=A0AAV5BS04_ELECO|nr:hypothetical protein PR202_ga04746 [Eleusine coracana subsp. coracana]